MTPRHGSHSNGEHASHEPKLAAPARRRASRNGAAETGAGRKGAEGGSATIEATRAFLGSPAAMSLAAGQQLAMEATRFWARRMRAYVDQLEALSYCADPAQFISTQARFVTRMQQDYADERRALVRMVKAPSGHGAASSDETRH